MHQIEVEIKKFLDTFDVNIANMQCIYDVEKQKWLVNYVSTNDGKVIGSEKCYKKTVVLAKRLEAGMLNAGNEDTLYKKES